MKNKYKAGDLICTRYPSYNFKDLHAGMIVRALMAGDLTDDEMEDTFSISFLVDDDEPVYVILFGQKTKLIPEYKILDYLTEESCV